MTIKWEIEHDCDDEFTEEPTCWGTKIEGQFWWISINPDGGYTVEVARAGIPLRLTLRTVKICKSLRSAKAWVTRNWKYYTED